MLLDLLMPCSGMESFSRVRLSLLLYRRRTNVTSILQINELECAGVERLWMDFFRHFHTELLVFAAGWEKNASW